MVIKHFLADIIPNMKRIQNDCKRSFLEKTDIQEAMILDPNRVPIARNSEDLKPYSFKKIKIANTCITTIPQVI
jgi:hypothetical protein